MGKLSRPAESPGSVCNLPDNEILMDRGRVLRRSGLGDRSG